MSKKKLLPGEYLKKSHVSIDMDGLEAELYAPEKLARIKATRPGQLANGATVVVQEDYIITVHRLDGRWSLTVKHDAEEMLLPHDVVERIRQLTDRIVSEARKDAAKRGAETRRGNAGEQLDQANIEADEVLARLNGPQD